jgi:hypothetical protein
VDCQLKGGHTHHSSKNRTGYASRVKNEGKGPNTPADSSKADAVKPSGDKITPPEDKKPRWYHCKEDWLICTDMDCHGHVHVGTRLHMESESFNEFMAKHPSATAPELEKAIRAIAKQSESVFGPKGAEWDNELSDIEDAADALLTPLPRDRFMREPAASPPVVALIATPTSESLREESTPQEEVKTVTVEVDLLPRHVARSSSTFMFGTDFLVVTRVASADNGVTWSCHDLVNKERSAGFDGSRIHSLDELTPVDGTTGGEDNSGAGALSDAPPLPPRRTNLDDAPEDEKHSSTGQVHPITSSSSDDARGWYGGGRGTVVERNSRLLQRTADAQEKFSDLSSRLIPAVESGSRKITRLFSTLLSSIPEEEEFKDSSASTTNFHPTPAMGEEAMASEVVQTEHSLARMPESWEEQLYGGKADNTDFMLVTKRVYVFTQQETTDHKFKKMTLLKNFLAKHTFLGAYESVIPVNDESETFLSEEKSEEKKDRVAVRWAWESTYAATTTTETYHAFKNSYTHASFLEVYPQIVAHFMSTPQLIRGRLMKDDRSCVLQDTAVGYLHQYMAGSPLLGLMNLRPKVRLNTEKHIMNQMIIMGLERRSVVPLATDVGGGLIDTPYKSSVFGHNFFTKSRHRQEVSHQATASKPGMIEQSFRSRVPSKTESPRGSPTVWGSASATISVIPNIVTMEGSP